MPGYCHTLYVSVGVQHTVQALACQPDGAQTLLDHLMFSSVMHSIPTVLHLHNMALLCYQWQLLIISVVKISTSQGLKRTSLNLSLACPRN